MNPEVSLINTYFDARAIEVISIKSFEVSSLRPFDSASNNFAKYMAMSANASKYTERKLYQMELVFRECAVLDVAVNSNHGRRQMHIRYGAQRFSVVRVEIVEWGHQLRG